MKTMHMAAALLVGLTLAGCASVSVFKIDTKTGKVAEGTPEGLRYYLPRPYVSVFEPFIVSSEVYVADGEMSPDSKYLLLTQVPAGLKDIVGDKLTSTGRPGMGDLRIDAKHVSVLQTGKTGAPQAATAAASAASSADTAASAPEPKKPEVSGGLLNYKATNDNSAFAITPQPRYFNILWLPDFDEQYVVTAKAGLGNAGVVLGLGQGWSLQSLDATVDTSAVVKPILDFYSNTLGSLQKLAVAKIEGPLGLLSGKPQSATTASADSFKGGTPVSVKVTKVRIVAPGLYPILKPGEKATLSNEAKKRILEPVQPLTNIAFNTYDVVVIEAAQATGDSALRIQQYVDSSGNKPSLPQTPDPARTGDASLAPVLKNLRVELSKPENATTAKEYFTAELTRDSAGAVVVTLTRSKGGQVGSLSALPDDATMKSKVKGILAKSSLVVDDQQIIIQPSP